MRHTHAALIALCCAAVTTVAAQDVTFHRAGAFGSVQGPAMDVIALDPLSLGPLVTDAPYSAEAVTEFTQVLADGNRIERRTTGKVARNSQGGVRREQGISFGPLAAANSQPFVTIDDPANGVHVMLNYDTKVASRVRMMSSMVMSGPNSSEPAVIAFGSAGAANVEMKRGAAIASGPIETMRVETTGDPGPLTMSWTSSVTAGVPFNGEVKNETLEPREIEGLRAEGTRSTVTLPAGSVGNVLPIETVSERWYSPQLKVVLLTRQSDPRFGETIYRLTNIDRSEPPADLFRVPDGFKTEEMKSGLPRLRRPPDQ
jgi:hypothetical protein